MSKRILATLCSALLILAMVPFAFAADAWTPVYKLSEDAEVQGADVGADFFGVLFPDENSASLTKSGDVVATVVDNNGVKAMGLERSNSWDGLDLLVGTVFETGKTYRVTVNISVGDLKNPADFGRDANGRIYFSDHGNAGLIDVPLAANKNYKIVYVGTAGVDFMESVRIASAGGDTTNYTVTEIVVEESAVAATAWTPVYKLSEDAEVQGADVGADFFGVLFPDEKSASLTKSGDVVATVVDNNGVKAMSLERSNSWDGLDLSVGTVFEDGKTYRVTVSISVGDLKNPADFGRDANGRIYFSDHGNAGLIDIPLAANKNYKIVCGGVAGVDFIESVRIASAGGDTTNYTITEIVVEEAVGTAVTAPPAAVVTAPPAAVVTAPPAAVVTAPPAAVVTAPPATLQPTTTGENPKTGDNSLIFIAIGVLLASGLGFVVFNKKRKNS